MSVEHIEKKILDDARAEAERIVTEAREQADARVTDAQAENEQRAEREIEAERADLEQQLGRKTTAEKAANRLKLLAHKTDLLDDVFEAAAEQFIGDRAGDYARWLAGQLRAVAGEEGRIVPAEPDRAALEELLAGLKDKAGLELADESLPLQGGFVLEGKTADLDLSLDTRLTELRSELKPELARNAFRDAPADHSE
jgi:vacuolar-type H+-ATPase subunit E/Vma4